MQPLHKGGSKIGKYNFQGYKIITYLFTITVSENTTKPIFVTHYEAGGNDHSYVSANFLTNDVRSTPIKNQHFVFHLSDLMSRGNDDV